MIIILTITAKFRLTARASNNSIDISEFLARFSKIGAYGCTIELIDDIDRSTGWQRSIGSLEKYSRWAGTNQ
jgi:hypothetical protein